MKELLLLPGPALSNRMEITVMDFPNGSPDLLSKDGGDINVDELIPIARKRCKITVEYGRPDVISLKGQGMDLDKAMEYYHTYINDLVRFHILAEWTAIWGMEESLAIIKERILPYFE